MLSKAEEFFPGQLIKNLYVYTITKIVIVLLKDTLLNAVEEVEKNYRCL